MLRVTFNSSNERAFQNVMRGLCVLAERSGKDASQAFSIYCVREQPSGASAAVGVEMVEIHNDEDTVFSSAMDQVINSIQRMPIIDFEIEKLAMSSAYTYSEKQYCMYPGQLFSAVPAALGYLVRNACPEKGSKKDTPPSVLRMDVSTPAITAVLDVLNQLADVALKSPGVVACLVQGIEAYANTAALLFIFATDMELMAFSSDGQVRMIAKTAQVTANGMTVALHGQVSAFAQRAAQDFILSLGNGRA